MRKTTPLFFQLFRQMVIIGLCASLLAVVAFPNDNSQMVAALKSMKISQKDLMETIDLLLAQGQITPEQAQQARLEISNMNQTEIERAQGEAVDLIQKQNAAPVATTAPASPTVSPPPPSTTSTGHNHNSDEQLKEALQYFNRTTK